MSELRITLFGSEDDPKYIQSLAESVKDALGGTVCYSYTVTGDDLTYMLISGVPKIFNLLVKVSGWSAVAEALLGSEIAHRVDGMRVL